MKISSATILLLALTLPSEIVAQVPLAAGDEIRVKDRRGLEHEGVFVSSTPDEIRLMTRSGAYAVPEAEIATVERSLGQRRRFGRNFALTVGLAAGAGAVLGAATWQPCNDTGFMACFLHPESRTDAFAWGLAGGGLLGVPIGIIVGLAVKSERWESIPMPASQGLALSLRRSSRGLDFVASIPVGGGGR